MLTLEVTWGAMPWGMGACFPKCTKQKLNTRSFVEVRAVSISNYMPNTIIDKNILHHDNQSAIKIKSNSKQLCGQKQHHIYVRYFSLKTVASEHIKLIHCPIDDMVSTFFTKTLQGNFF